MGILAIGLSVILAASWFISEWQRVDMRDTIKKTRSSEATLKEELTDAKTESTTYSERLKDIEKQLRAKTAENERLVAQLSNETNEKKNLLSERSLLEAKLKVFEEDRVSTAALPDSEALLIKLRNAREAVKRARSSGLIGGGLAEEILASIDEAEGILDQARFGRAPSDAELGAGSTELMAKRFQDNLKRRTRDDFKLRVSALEERLVSLSETKKVMEEKWSEAMTAILKMDDTARRIEAGLKTGTDAAEFETLGIATPEGLTKLRGEMETLEQARADVRDVLEKIKSTIENNIEDETKRMLSETAQVSEALTGLFAEADAQGLKIRAAPGAGQLENITLLDKNLDDLNALLGSALEFRDPTRFAMQERDFDIYVVKEGDTLWDIAAKEGIYGDPFLWPLLYKDNSLALKNPDIIEPALKLMVRKGVSREEIAAALLEARGGRPIEPGASYTEEWLREICAPYR